MKNWTILGSTLCLWLVAGCSSSSATGTRDPDSGLTLMQIDATSGDDAGFADDATTPSHDAGPLDDAAPKGDATADAPPNRCTAGSDRFIKEVVSFDPGPCAGFGANELPSVVCGPPEGFGADEGSTDVVSLGNGGSIVVGFGGNEIVDGDGPDFIVFENPFDYGAESVFAEPGEVSVSEDGVTWTSFPCTDTTQNPPYGQCAGVNPVFSNPDNAISPFAIPAAGGDAYDLKTIGVPSAKYVRIRDKVIEACPDASSAPTTNGFDLDAIAIVNAKLP